MMHCLEVTLLFIMALSKLARVKHQCVAALKWLASFTTRDWELKDYPVFVRKQVEDQPTVLSSPRFQLPTFVASTVKWHLSGFGESPDEARAALAKTFADVKENRVSEGRQLPRPGTRVPLEFASTTSIDTHPELTQNFIQRVLDWNGHLFQMSQACGIFVPNARMNI